MDYLKLLLQDFGNIFAFSSGIILTLITPLIEDCKCIKKIGIISLIIYGIYLLLGVIALLFLIPSSTEINNTLSIYILARKVSFGDFIQRIDAMFILIWIMSIFSYLAIVLHFVLVAFKKITSIKHESSMVYCFSAFLFIIALLPRNISDTTYFETNFYKYASIILVFFVGSVILFWGYIKKKRELKKGEKRIEEIS